MEFTLERMRREVIVLNDRICQNDKDPKIKEKIKWFYSINVRIEMNRKTGLYYVIVGYAEKDDFEQQIALEEYEYKQLLTELQKVVNVTLENIAIPIISRYAIEVEAKYLQLQKMKQMLGVMKDDR
jgi:hypothetical protein